MNKIPVFVTIGGAYRFAFGRFFGNLGVVWLPALLVMAGAWYFLPHMMLPTTGHMAIKPGMTPAQLSVAMRGMMQVYRAMILFWGVAILLRAEMMLGLTERALGTAKGPGFVYLSLGRAYWRVAGSYFAVTVILMAVYIVLLIAAVLIGLLVALVVGLGAAAAASCHGRRQERRWRDGRSAHFRPRPHCDGCADLRGRPADLLSHGCDRR